MQVSLLFFEMHGREINKTSEVLSLPLPLKLEIGIERSLETFFGRKEILWQD